MPHGDLAALAHGVRRVLTEPKLAASMSAQAAILAPGLRWSSVAAQYRTLVAGLVPDSAIAA